jgi:4-hydroxybenzoate polyprenyltransferase
VAPPSVRRLGGFVRLVHPFPSLLDAILTGAIAAIAGGTPAVCARLAVAMLCLQAAIGAVNDIVDAAADADRKPGKPIPAGTVDPSAARLVAATALVTGLGLSAPSGPAVVAIGLLGVAIGLSYDLRLSGTRWSWLPFALGIPLLPVYAWLGGSGDLPGVFLILLPMGFLAGAALAHANALADLERDRAAGTTTVATALGREGAWRIGAALQAVVAVNAVTMVAVVGGDVRALVAALVAAGLIILGLALGRSDDPWRRTRGWEVQGVGVGLLAAAWLAGIVVTGTA